MLYASNADLPDAVRKALPQHAQDIYRAAYNQALTRYGHERETIARRMAWAAVKRCYVRRATGIWIERSRAREPAAWKPRIRCVLVRTAGNRRVRSPNALGRP